MLAADPDSPSPSHRTLLLAAGSAFLLIQTLKLFFAGQLDLYSDEIFYWLASTHPALAYSDLPFVTAQLAGLGAALAPGSALAVRSLFLLLGASVPLLIYWLARPLTTPRQALEAAAVSLCVPLGGFLGLLAVPDVPLIVLGLMAVGFFERALRSNAWRYWLATGLCVALGLSTHYRFILYPTAVVLFLLAFSPARQYWRNPRFWFSIAVASIGLIPIVWFNLSHALSSASFYFIDRHPWEFQASGLLHLFKQIGLVTPPLYALLVYSAWWLWRQARYGQQVAALLLSLALTHILVYLVLAPWADANSTSIHWPLSGYFPLLVLLPAALRDLGERLALRYSAIRLRQGLALVVGIGFTGTLVAILGVGSQAYQLPLQRLLGTGVLSNKMAGWEQFAEHTDALLAQQFPGRDPVLVTDNYYTAAQALFARVGEDAYTLDRDKAVRDGRITQLMLWEMDTSHLGNAAGSPALYINEDSTLEVTDKHALMADFCQHANQVRHLGDLSLFNGDKRFSFYRAETLHARQTPRASPCPFPMRAWIDSPGADSTVSGQVPVNGWAYSEDIGVASVTLLLDGEPVQQLDYGIARPDVVLAQAVTTDPNAPALGFGGQWDSQSVANGNYRLAIEIRNRQGSVLRYGERSIEVDNRGIPD